MNSLFTWFGIVKNENDKLTFFSVNKIYKSLEEKQLVYIILLLTLGMR
jgi:hypothetical protein